MVRFQPKRRYSYFYQFNCKIYHSGPKAIRRYLEFLNDWYAGQSDSLPEESLAKFRNKYEGVSVTWPDKVIHHRPSLL